MDTAKDGTDTFIIASDTTSTYGVGYLFLKADLFVLLFNPFLVPLLQYIISVYLWKTGIAARRVPTQYTLLYYKNSVAVFRNRQLFFSNEFGIPYVRTDNTQRKRINQFQ